jgi:nicotinamide-nucleotide amidase
LAGSDLGLSVSGIAGPTGGTPEKPVGTVHMALSGTDLEDWRVFAFQGDRRQVKEQSALEALLMVRACCQRGQNR